MFFCFQTASLGGMAGDWWGNLECNPQPWLRNLENISGWGLVGKLSVNKI